MLGTEAGVVIAKGTSEVHFTVKLCLGTGFRVGMV